MADLPNEPITRQEMYLSRLAGENPTLPREPITREEMYLEGAVTHIEGMEQDIDTLQHQVAAMATDMKYQGSVEDAQHLPSTAKKGDVYTTTDSGKEYVYDGSNWIEIGGGGSGSETINNQDWSNLWQ